MSNEKLPGTIPNDVLNDIINACNSFNSTLTNILEAKKKRQSDKQENIPEWEVECFAGNGRNFWLQKGGGYRSEPFQTNISKEHFIEDPNIFTIHSVRRLSTGEVFSVGEEVEHFTNQYRSKIVGFCHDHINYFYFEEDKTHVKDLINFIKIPTPPKEDKPVLDEKDDNWAYHCQMVKTQAEFDKAEQEAFKAGREPVGFYKIATQALQYPEFEDYLKSKK